ncbi:MAG: DUF4214 domain-containing protein [Planctomycetes bacterium]|nr:DUF4214 domain-containing protein [Planctomycetota bacterium]
MTAHDRSRPMPGGLIALALLIGVLLTGPAGIQAAAAPSGPFQNAVQAAYLAYYARSADPGGLAFWSDALADAEGDLDRLIATFANSAEYRARYQDMSDEELVDTVYQQLFGRAAEPAGKRFYLERLQSGAATRASVVLEILTGAQGEDLRVLTNKLAASSYFTARVAASQAAYDEDTKAENIALLEAVGADDATLDSAHAATDDYVAVYAPVTIIHINDHHSHLEPNTGATLAFDGIETDVETGGFPRVITKVYDLLRDSYQPLVLHAGDAITGTIFFSSFKGRADADLMNEICFDAFALGNHEFDDSDAGLADFLGFLNGDERGCTTPVLAANVVPEVGTPLRPDADTSLIQDYMIRDFGGTRVGVIGIDIAGKTQNSSSPLPTTRFLDERETAQAKIDELSAQGIDRIVLLTHFQYENDLQLAQELRGVDVIIGGDSHTLLGEAFADLGLNTQGPYPTVVNDLDGQPVCVAQAWQFSELVGELRVLFDRQGQVRRCDGTPHLLLGDTFERDGVALAGAQRLEVLDLIAATPELSIVRPDDRGERILGFYSDQLDELTQTVVGIADEDLCLERIPGQGRSSLCPVEATQANGGDIQQLVTEAFLQRSFEADIALQNAGGVRIDIPAGEFTIATVFELLPFANTLVNLEMTGAEIEQVLEEAVANFQDGEGSTGSYPYAANLRWDLDLSQPAGSRFSNIQIRRRGSDEWLALEGSDQVTVVTNSFIAAGRDGYFTFGDVSDDGRATDTFIDYAQAFIDFLQQDVGGAEPGDPILVPPPSVGAVPCADYSTQSFIDAAGVPLLPDPAVGRACE